MRNNNGVHQYATDPEWANKIASIMDGMPKNYSSQLLSNNNTGNTNDIMRERKVKIPGEEFEKIKTGIICTFFF